MNKLRQLQLVELEMLKEIIKICDENNIRYYLMGGTLLGAVRHKGFIPWDDDIDIGMPRADYERFLQLVHEKTIKNYRLDHYYYCKESLIYIARLENEDFKIVDKSAEVEKTRNAWVDIFPLDGMPNNRLIKQIHKISLLYSRLVFKYSIFSKFVNQRTKGRPLHEKVLIKLGQLLNIESKLSKDKCLNKLDKKLKRYSYDESKYVVNFMGAYKFREMFSKKIYDEVEKYSFENLELTGPKNYDFVLKQLYGDYMKEPEDKNHHFTEI